MIVNLLIGYIGKTKIGRYRETKFGSPPIYTNWAADTLSFRSVFIPKGTEQQGFVTSSLEKDSGNEERSTNSRILDKSTLWVYEHQEESCTNKWTNQSTDQ